MEEPFLRSHCPGGAGCFCDGVEHVYVRRRSRSRTATPQPPARASMRSRFSEVTEESGEPNTSAAVVMETVTSSAESRTTASTTRVTRTSRRSLQSLTTRASDGGHSRGQSGARAAEVSSGQRALVETSLGGVGAAARDSRRSAARTEWEQGIVSKQGGAGPAEHLHSADSGGEYHTYGSDEEYEQFINQPKTDYTYARSASYTALRPEQVTPPNMSRRRLHRAGRAADARSDGRHESGAAAATWRRESAAHYSSAATAAAAAGSLYQMSAGLDVDSGDEADCEVVHTSGVERHASRALHTRHHSWQLVTVLRRVLAVLVYPVTAAAAAAARLTGPAAAAPLPAAAPAAGRLHYHRLRAQQLGAGAGQPAQLLTTGGGKSAAAGGRVSSAVTTLWTAVSTALLSVWSGVSSASASVYHGAESASTALWRGVSAAPGGVYHVAEVGVWSGARSAFAALGTAATWLTQTAGDGAAAAAGGAGAITAAAAGGAGAITAAAAAVAGRSAALTERLSAGAARGAGAVGGGLAAGWAAARQGAGSLWQTEERRSRYDARSGRFVDVKDSVRRRRWCLCLLPLLLLLLLPLLLMLFGVWGGEREAAPAPAPAPGAAELGRLALLWKAVSDTGSYVIATTGSAASATYGYLSLLGSGPPAPAAPPPQPTPVLAGADSDQLTAIRAQLAQMETRLQTALQGCGGARAPEPAAVRAALQLTPSARLLTPADVLTLERRVLARQRRLERQLRGARGRQQTAAGRLGAVERRQQGGDSAAAAAAGRLDQLTAELGDLQRELLLLQDGAAQMRSCCNRTAADWSGLLGGRLRELEQQLDSRLQRHAAAIRHELAAAAAAAAGGGGAPLAAGALTRQEVAEIARRALALYDADKTGRFDFALESAGGSVVSTRCTEPYSVHSARISVLGIPLWYPSNNPRQVIQPSTSPGECFAFAGAGFFVVSLSRRVRPTEFVVEHIARSLTPGADIASAPRHFSVLGLRDAADQEGRLLGKYEYQKSGPPLQHFAVPPPTAAAAAELTEEFSVVELRISSNWGHPNYTCLYRFRVHGPPDLDLAAPISVDNS